MVEEKRSQQPYLKKRTKVEEERGGGGDGRGEEMEEGRRWRREVLHVTHDVCFQGNILEEGVQLHSQVCPESMRALHNRMEDLLEDYLSNYGNQNAIGSQEPPKLSAKKKLTTSGMPGTPPSIPPHRQGKPTPLPRVQSINLMLVSTATVVLEDEPLTLPPSSPATALRQSSSSSALDSESRPPPPPRSTSVRHRMSGNFGSKESIDKDSAALGTTSQVSQL